MFLFDVTVNFDKACDALLAHDPMLLKFVKNHERRNLVLNNLCGQILQYERRFGAKVQLSKRNELILATARMFIDACRQHHTQKTWTEAERRRQEKKAEPFKEMEEICTDAGGRVYTNGVLTEVETLKPKEH